MSPTKLKTIDELYENKRKKERERRARTSEINVLFHTIIGAKEDRAFLIKSGWVFCDKKIAVRINSYFAVRYVHEKKFLSNWIKKERKRFHRNSRAQLDINGKSKSLPLNSRV